MKHTTVRAGKFNLGATCLGSEGVEFRVWAPRASDMSVKVLKPKGAPKDAASFSMRKDEEGYFTCRANGVRHGDRYFFELPGGVERPDPASRFQPEGVHGPSEVVDPKRFRWRDRPWKGIALSNLILYELHVGTFTKEGTFEAIIPKIPYLKKLGVTAIELMPVAQFSGVHNWGYDGVGLFAVQNTYGGPDGLKKLVNACHEAGLGVCLDVVYNHLGPEGNYLSEFGPYFNNRYRTPWGDAVNYDGARAEAVRDFFIRNALFWITEYHMDALRLDAVQGIFDSSKPHILEELNDTVKAEARRLARHVLVIAESDLNDPIMIKTKHEGGYHLDAQWSDDFHHSVHVVLTGEQRGYYADYDHLEDIAKAIKSGFVYDGKYSAFRQTEYGRPAKGIPGERFVISIQNHDQVGNRAFGDRLSTQVSFRAQKAAAALLLAAPATPLLFMGQEYGETAPFQYFVDHGNGDLINQIKEGRKAECATFGWHEVSDPKDPKTFQSSKLNWNLHKKGEPGFLLRLYQDLARLRHSIPGLSRLNRKHFRVYVNEGKRWLAMEYPFAVRGAGLGVIISFSEEKNEIVLPFQHCKTFEVLLDTEHKSYGGSVSEKKEQHTKKIILGPEHGIIGRIR